MRTMEAPDIGLPVSVAVILPVTVPAFIDCGRLRFLRVVWRLSDGLPVGGVVVGGVFVEDAGVTGGAAWLSWARAMGAMARLPARSKVVSSTCSCRMKLVKRFLFLLDTRITTGSERKLPSTILNFSFLNW